MPSREQSQLTSRQAFVLRKVVEGHVEIVNFALTLELLEAEFYEQALDRLGLSGEVRDAVEPFIKS